MFTYIQKKLSELRDMVRQYPVFRRRSFPIESLESASEFVATRAAFVAQKTMFGYVKTRMGTSYPEMFRDDVMVSSQNRNPLPLLGVSRRFNDLRLPYII